MMETTMSRSDMHMYQFEWSNERFLQGTDQSNNSTIPANNTTCSGLATTNDAAVLRSTMRFYGSIFLVILVTFCILRRRFPRVYNLRNWIPELKTDLAEDLRGTLAWAWKLFFITDLEMMDECGMDALCYARVLEFGMKLSLVGTLNAIWLIPVYATTPPSEATSCIKDWVVKSSVSNLTPGSVRFCATVVGAYIVFGFTMYTMLQEFQWFTRYRYQFLSKPLPRNYCVYVQCIPREFRSNQKLLNFFQQSSSQGTVLEARLAVKTPTLKKKVAEREALVAKLEHAINVEAATGTTLSQTRMGLFRTGESLIDALLRQLEELNQIISESIDRIQRLANETTSDLEQPGAADSNETQTYLACSEGVALGHCSDRNDPSSQATSTMIDRILRMANETTTDLQQPADSNETQTYQESSEGLAWEHGGATNDPSSQATSTLNQNKTLGASATVSMTSLDTEERTSAINQATSLLFDNPATTSLRGTFRTAINAAGSVANVATSLLTSQDGEPQSAGFVTFRSLRAVQAAKQMIQYSEPFAMEVLEAPQPEDVFWKNTGKSHHELQLGKLLSFSLTAALCLLWTIPMGFISTLSSIDGLRGESEFVNELLTEYPGLEPFFAQLAPLMIVVANVILKMILETLSGLEGPISGAVVQAKLFTKLSSFMIIQTFFVTAIGSSIVSSLSAMIQEPGLIVDLLAKTLPTQSTFYIQILLVDTFLSMGIELLRVSAVVQSAIRSCIGPRLTEKEQQTTWMGIRPLSDPSGFDHASVLAGTVLYFTVYFVYAALAPITTIFMFLCFTLMGAGYRHQFVYIYPTFPDSGGKLWAAFFRMVPVCMIIAQVTIVGMLALNKAATASAMMIPLLIVTVLFSMYIQQKHFVLTEHLPAKDAMAVDLKNKALGEMNYDFVIDKYIQPELRDREILPENLPVERETEQGRVQFITQPGSKSGFDPEGRFDN